MKKQTLDSFIIQAIVSWPHNAYVDEPGFDILYVRISDRSIEGNYER